MSEMDMEDSEYKAKQLRFEYSTPELIAELERRRPCDRCSYAKTITCTACLWSGIWLAKEHKDNFKEAK